MTEIDPDTLLNAYSQGAFPMADPDGRIRWFTADPRGILPIDALRVSRSLRATIRRARFDIRFNTRFRDVMLECASHRPEGSWISPGLIDSYVRLHRLGYAHSVETWQDDRLVGGLYGVALGGAFFGESMFHRVNDASKVALVALVERLRERQFVLHDTQTVTNHLRTMGCIEIPARQYMRLLREAITLDRTFI